MLDKSENYKTIYRRWRLSKVFSQYKELANHLRQERELSKYVRQEGEL